MSPPPKGCAVAVGAKCARSTQSLSGSVRTSFQWICTTLARDGTGKDKETVWTAVCSEDRTAVDQVRRDVCAHTCPRENTEI